MNAMQLIEQKGAFEFAGLPRAVKDDTVLMLDYCLRIDGSTNKGLTIKELAAEMLGADGYSAVNIRRKYDKWRHAGRDWRALVDYRRMPKNKTANALEQIYKYYCENNQRSSRAACRRMLEDLHAGKELNPVKWTWVDFYKAEFKNRIPPKECPRDYIPAGATYRSLQRKFGLSKFESVSMRIGRAAARDYIMPVLTTRVGLKPGEIYMFDDVWHDLDCFFGSQVVRPMELACLDVASGCKVHYGLKPRMYDADGKRRNLNERDMRFLFAYVVCKIGYLKTGTTFITEHGTAALPKAMKEQLSALSNGALKFVESGIINEQVLKGSLPGCVGGNFRLKAALESHHNLPHLEAAHLPAQLGSNGRTSRPEQADKLETYTKDILKLASELSTERRNMLMFEMLEYNRYARIYDEMVYRINARTWHDLEGWEQAGNMIEEFRVSDQSDSWLPMSMLLDMDPVQAAAIRALIRSNPALFARARKLSPLEVWQHGTANLVQLSKHCIPDLLGPNLALDKQIPVQQNGLITFQNQHLGPGDHVFPAVVTTPAGFQQALRPGAKYIVHCSPLDPAEIFLTAPENMQYIGFANRLNVPCKNDTEGIYHQIGKQNAHEARLMAPIRERHSDKQANHAAIMAYNEAVLDGSEPTPTDIFRRERTDAQPDVNDEVFATKKPGEEKEFCAEEIYDYLRN